MTQLPLVDLIIICFYLLGILSTGIWVSRRQTMTGSVYFLAGRSLNWLIVGTALFASNISTIHLVGLAASGYHDGLVWGNFEWMAVFTLILLGLVFAPFYFKSTISTLPEFLERRYGPESRSFLAFMAILAALFIHIGMSLYAAAAVFERFFGIRAVTSIAIISIIIGIYTVLGGLKAVVITESIQVIFLLTGAISVTIFAIMALPASGIHSMSELRSAVKPGQLSMIQTHSSAGLPWYAVLLGYPVLGIWYWCTDQTIVQRVLGARSEVDAQIGPLFAGFLKLLPVFIMVFPGVLAYVLFRSEIGLNSNQALPVLIAHLIPTGLRGLILAGMLAALMSTVSSALNSSATLVAVDIVKRLRPSTSDRSQVRAGQVSAIVVMLLAMLWSTYGGRYSSIFEAINAIASELAPPITTVFLWGVFWRRGTRQAALITLISGFLLGALIFIVDLPVIGSEKLITTRWGIPFMMQAWWSFCICSGIYVGVSLLTPPPDPDQVDPLTWAHPLAVIQSGPKQPRIIATLLLLVTGILYFIFR
jgi:SSS family solute:Na+ symporter